MDEEPERVKHWEGGYERTWEVLKEDESGSLKDTVEDILFQAKRKRLINEYMKEGDPILPSSRTAGGSGGLRSIKLSFHSSQRIEMPHQSGAQCWRGPPGPPGVSDGRQLRLSNGSSD